MNAPEKFFLPDIQAAADTRQLAIQHVGVKGLRYPLRVRSGAAAETVATVASLSTTVGLPPHVKDTHMSRFVVESENFESIHNHSAYASIEGDNP